jgi:hypothetical protein
LYCCSAGSKIDLFLTQESVEAWKEFLTKVYYEKDPTTKVYLKFENSFCHKVLFIETTGMVRRDSRSGPMIAIAQEITEKRLIDEIKSKLERSLSTQQSYSTRL